MTVSRSTPRLRLTVLLLVATLGTVAVSDRTLLDGATGALVQLAGLAVISCAALGRVWTSTFIAGFKDASIVREGPYSALRHPLYALSLAAMLGVGLASRSAAITIALVAVFAIVFRRAAREEDRFLADAHGEAFETFRREVPAFWPVLRAYRVPDTIEVRPRIFWKAFLDAGSLLGYYMLLRVADLAQLHGVTPTWVELP
jgi:protein-S-isoprenylcysteine O-methyltransferase Ste14